MKRFIFLFLTVFVAATMLTGCGKQGSLYGKSKVLDYMQEKVPQEKYSLKSVEKVPDADVSTEIYTFQSKERDLEFVAKNTRNAVFSDAGVYGKAIVPQYVEAVHELYQEDIEYILEPEVLPQKYSDVAHISTLHHIYLNGEDISEKAHATAKKKKLNNNSDGMYTSGYCYKLEDYIVPINVGLTDDKYAPQMMEEVFDLLGADYDIEYGRGVVSWKYNGDKWEIKAHDTDNEIQSFVVKKNGKTIDVPYVICGEWTSPISGTYVVGIRATDFADIFDLKMQVDEYGDCIKFETK